MIKVNYDKETGEIKGFYPDNISYANIPAPYIEIDETTHQDCMNYQGLRKVDVVTQKIVACELPAVATPIKDVEPVDPSLLAIAEALATQETRLAKLEGGVSK